MIEAPLRWTNETKITMTSPPPPPPGTPHADEADMREVSHFLSELKNGSESRAGDVACEIPHSAPAHEVGAGSDVDPPPSATPLDPLQKASPDTKVGGRHTTVLLCCWGRTRYLSLAILRRCSMSRYPHQIDCFEFSPHTLQSTTRNPMGSDSVFISRTLADLHVQ